MFFQTGSVIGRSFTSEGDMNPGKVPIQEITSGSGGNKMQALIRLRKEDIIQQVTMIKMR